MTLGGADGAVVLVTVVTETVLGLVETKDGDCGEETVLVVAGIVISRLSPVMIGECGIFPYLDMDGLAVRDVLLR